MSDPQEVFYSLMDKYNSGVEPLQNWTTVDIVALIDAADAELQNRAPPDSGDHGDHCEFIDNAEEDYE